MYTMKACKSKIFPSTKIKRQYLLLLLCLFYANHVRHLSFYRKGNEHRLAKEINAQSYASSKHKINKE